jgi:protein TonB
MFEDSLFASGVSQDKRRSARRTRWIALTSIGLQGLVVLAFLVVPMIWPETLPLVSVAPKVTLVALHKEPPKIEPKPVRVNVASNSSAVSAPAPQVQVTHVGSIIQRGASTVTAGEAPSFLNPGMGSGGSLLAGGGFAIGESAAPSVVAAAPRKSGPLTISSGVSKGLLLAPIQPIYPRIAVQARVEGTVILTATIDKQGRITGLQVLSGNPMLTTAAVDAVKEARYKPYLLNGQPTDVVTTISVTFRIGA